MSDVRVRAEGLAESGRAAALAGNWVVATSEFDRASRVCREAADASPLPDEAQRLGDLARAYSRSADVYRGRIDG
jgi:hypothetical protein